MHAKSEIIPAGLRASVGSAGDAPAGLAPFAAPPAASLRVGWLSPFGPRSDIGTFSRAILGAAAVSPAGLDLRLLLNPNGPSYFHDGPVVPLGGPQDEALLGAFDAVIYNIGNNVENHGHINRLALRHPGVVIVHDLVMQHYLAWEVFERLRDPAIYADLLTAHYGQRGVEALAASRICAEDAKPRYAPWDSTHAVDMSLIEPFIRSAAAVVVHSAHAEREVARCFAGPMLRLALPHDQKPALSEAEIATWAAATRRRESVNFAAFGHIGRGKCLPLLIEAFRQRPELAQRATLTIAGYPTDLAHAQELEELVRALDLRSVVRLEYGVSTERLQQLKRDADVFVNLRWPNTEAASGSLIEQLNTGKPTLVYATGCYAEVPEDAAFRVLPINSAPALAEAMLRAAGDAEARVAVGAAGRDYARRLSAAEYVRRLGGFLREHAALLRDRRSRHRLLRAAAPQGLSGAALAADTAWVAGLAFARDSVEAIVDGAPTIGPRPFLHLDEAALRGFVMHGLFGRADPAASPLLRDRVDALLAAGDRLRAYRIIRQAAEVRRILRHAEALGPRPHARPDELGPPEPEAMALLAALGPELFAGAAYVLVLGRAPAPSEATGYAARLGGGEPAARVIDEMLASGEYGARRLPAAHAEALRAGARAAAELLRAEPIPGPTLEPGRPLLLRAGTHPPPAGLLHGAWHAPEPEGVWSASANARLSLRLRAEPLAPRRLWLRLRVPVPPGGPPRMLRLMVGQEIAQRIAFENDSWREVVLELSPAPARREAEAARVQLTLDVGTTMPATQLGNAGDPRSLGVMLGAVALLASEEEEAAPVEALLIEPAVPIDFRQRRPDPAMLPAGWHAAEPDGIWSDGEAAAATLRFVRSTEPARPARLLVHLELPPPDAAPSRDVLASLDGGEPRRFAFPPRARQVVLDVPLGAPGPEAGGTAQHLLRIDSEAAFRPSDAGLSSDRRLLGVRLLRIELVTAETEPACAAP
jgi:glycosyltransferase involved in cell wall biosynthesis